MMKSEFSIICGNALEIAQQIEQVHCVVTSPPYFKKRKYGNNSSEIGWGDIDSYLDCLCDLFASIDLHPLGSIWVNIGDKREAGVLQHIPERFLLKMCDRGFLHLDTVIWAKVVDFDDGSTAGGCMTEPTVGRLNGNGFEPLYRFSRVKPNESWTDTCAVALPRQNVEDIRYLPENLMSVHSSIEGRALHNVWRVNMGQTKDEHFACFPSALVERPIAMTCPICVNPDGTLPRRIVCMEEYNEGRGASRTFGKYSFAEEEGIKEKAGRQDIGRSYVAKKPVTTGWGEAHADSTPGIVLDPFSGTGTTGVAALKLGRNYIGFDLYESYCEISRQNCQAAIDLMEQQNLNPWVLMR